MPLSPSLLVAGETDGLTGCLASGGSELHMAEVNSGPCREPLKPQSYSPQMGPGQILVKISEFVGDPDTALHSDKVI